MSKFSKLKLFPFAVALQLSILSPSAFSGDKQLWFFNTNFSLTSANYADSQSTSQQNTGKFILGAEYLEKTQLQFIYGHSQFSYHDTTISYSQNTSGLTVRQYFYTDLLNGKNGLHVGFLSIGGKNVLKTNIYTGSLDYLNNQRNFYARLSYTQSDYGRNNSEFTIKQFKPTLGFQAYFKSLWLQVSAIDIKHSDGQEFQSVTYSVTHYIISKSRYMPLSISIGASNGKQQYYVDDEYWMIYNSDNIQTLSAFLSANWYLKDNLFLSLTGGRENYTDNTQSKFGINYLSSTLSIIW